VIQKHCPGFGPNCHDHPLVTLTGAATQFTAPDHGDGSFFEIKLTATDSGGLTGTTSRQVNAKTLQITLTASPSSGTVTYDGTAHTPPYTATTIAGSTHSISAQPPAGQTFGGWAHGGAQQQNVTVGTQNVTYTANMGAPPSACSPRPRVNISSASAGANARQVAVSTTANPGFSAPTISAIQVHETRFSTVEAAGVPPTSGEFTIPVANGSTEATFTIRRSQPGKILVSYSVVDTCGSWKTFIGSGSTTGF
jgi:hypothetical protein